MSGSLQSHDYVPGMSGLKIDLKTGKLEINTCTLGSAAKAPERQMVSVEVSSWSKWDLPKNAANLLQFMQAELQKVPEQYRHAAEFEEFDASYGNESFNARLFLSYSRLETERELADRLERAKVAGATDKYFADIIGKTPLYQALREEIDQISNLGSINKRLDELKEKQGAENRAVAGRLDSLATKLGELHSLIGQAKGQAATQAKREIAEALLRDIKQDKNGGTLGDCKRRFGACSIPFGGYSGVPLKVDYPKDAARSDDDGDLAEAIKDWQPGAALKAGGVASAINAVSSASAEPRHAAQLVVDIEGLEADFAKIVKDVIRSELLPGGLLHRSR